jgi:hypothetical protein
MIRELGNILDETQIRALQAEGFLGGQYNESDYVKRICGGRLLPKVDKMIVSSRTVLSTKAVKEKMRFYLDNLGYANLAR